MKTTNHQPPPNPLIGEFAPPAERQYYSVGFICGVVNCAPDFVERLMRAAEVSFTCTWDGVGMVNGSDLQKMLTTLRDVHDAMEDASQKAAKAPCN